METAACAGFVIDSGIFSFDPFVCLTFQFSVWFVVGDNSPKRFREKL